MSQQPPYGSEEPKQPHQSYQQPYQQPYAQGAYPYQAAYPQRRDHTTRNVLLIVGGVILLGCFGLFAFVVWGISNVDDAFDNDYAGSEDEPLTVAEGDPFEIRGFDYEEGWSVTTGPDGSVEIADVRGTNNRDDDDSASIYLVFKFYSGNEQLGTVNCNGGSSVAPERSVTLDCSSFAEGIADFDEIEVYDTSFYE